jgi:hypothetical protein
MNNCKKCGAPLQIPPTGRRPEYCGQGCRRLSEFEIRRLSRELDRLETQRINLAQPGIRSSRLRDIYGRSSEKQLTDTVHSIETVESRLRVLLGAESEEKE